MINQREILHHSSSVSDEMRSILVEAARILGIQTAFLAHSYSDRRLAKGVQAYLSSKGWDVYIDWQDSSMPRSPNKITAEKLKKQIR